MGGPKVTRFGCAVAALGLTVGALLVSAATPAAATTTTTPAQIVSPNAFLYQVACASPTTCYIVGNTQNVPGAPGSGAIVVVTNGVAGTAQPLGPGYVLNEVVCYDATTCVAFGSFRVPGSPRTVVPTPIRVVITNGVIGAPEDIPYEYSTIGCFTAAYCVGATTVRVDGVARLAVVVLANGVPGTPLPAPEAVESINEIACSGIDTCYAVGQTPPDPDNPDIFDEPQPFGVLLPVVGGVIGTPEVVPSTAVLDSVACAGSTTCQATGSGNDIFVPLQLLVPIVDGVAGTPQTVDGVDVITAVGCLTETTCEVVGFSSDPDTNQSFGLVVPILNGVPGPIHKVTDSNGLLEVACAAPSCVAIGNLNIPGMSTVGVVVAISEQPNAPTSLICKGRTNTDGTRIAVCTVSDADGIRTLQVRNAATGASSASLTFGCSGTPTTTATFRVPVGTRYRVVVNDCASPSVRSTLVIRPDGRVSLP